MAPLPKNVLPRMSVFNEPCLSVAFPQRLFTFSKFHHASEGLCNVLWVPFISFHHLKQTNLLFYAIDPLWLSALDEAPSVRRHHLSMATPECHSWPLRPRLPSIGWISPLRRCGRWPAILPHGIFAAIKFFTQLLTADLQPWTKPSSLLVNQWKE